MTRRRHQASRKMTRKEASQEEQAPPENPGQHVADMDAARAMVTSQVVPAVEEFRDFMLEQNRKLEVATFLDHIEGPQIMLQISRPDGRITATFIAEVTAAGIRPYWDATSTGRVKTHWTENVPGGAAGVTRDGVLEKLKDLYHTDFS